MQGKTLVAMAAAAVLGAACVEMAEYDSLRRPVIGGDPTPPGMYEATGALLMSFGDGPMEFGCTGTLIAPTVVLTAAHCLYDPFDEEVIVPSFTLALDAWSATPDEIVAGAVAHVHPSFDWDWDQEPDPGVTKWDDIGVLILAAPIDGVPYERLPTTAEAEALVAGLPVELVGYGMTYLDWSWDDWDEEDWEEEEWDEAGVKHHGTGTLVEVGDWELWISEPGEQQNCFGDSGGPALVDLGNGRRLVGIVSRAPDAESLCSNGGIDTRVDPYLPWIYEVSGCGDRLVDCIGELDEDGAGCGCAAGRPPGPSPWPLFAAIPLLWLVATRRRPAPLRPRSTP